MFLVGLTGGIGSGKSTVCNYFRQHNIPIIDADQIAREVVEPGKPAWKELKESFGNEYFDATTGALDRKKLGSVVFANAELRRKLNCIVHPRIRWEISKQLFHMLFQGHQFVLLDLPLLFESKWHRLVQYTIVVTCDERKQLERVVSRDQMSEKEARQRIDSQMPLAEKVKLATFVIDNNGTIQQTRDQADDIFKTLSASRLHWWYRLILVAAVALFASIAFTVLKRVIGW